jgi:hypothetical protein
VDERRRSSPMTTAGRVAGTRWVAAGPESARPTDRSDGRLARDRAARGRPGRVDQVGAPEARRAGGARARASASRRQAPHESSANFSSRSGPSSEAQGRDPCHSAAPIPCGGPERGTAIGEAPRGPAVPLAHTSPPRGNRVGTRGAETTRAGRLPGGPNRPSQRRFSGQREVAREFPRLLLIPRSQVRSLHGPHSPVWGGHGGGGGGVVSHARKVSQSARLSSTGPPSGWSIASGASAGRPSTLLRK